MPYEDSDPEDSEEPQIFALKKERSGWFWWGNRNVDDFMEPFATRSSTDLLTGRLYQDLGWGVNRSSVGWVDGSRSILLATTTCGLAASAEPKCASSRLMTSKSCRNGSVKPWIAPAAGAALPSSRS